MASIAVNGATFECIEHGAGSPVVFVHGSASDYRTWQGPLETFGDGYRAIAYSRRYHWPNAAIESGASYSLAEHAADLGEAVRALDASPAHLVGHSYGGLVCLRLAADAPEHVRSLTLMEPPVLGLFGRVPPKLGAMLRLALRSPRTAAGIVGLGAFGLGPAAAALERGDEDSAIRWMGNAILGREAFDALSEERTAQVRDNLIAAELTSPEAFPPLAAADLEKVNAPTLLLGSARSPRVFRLLLDRLEPILPHSQRLEIPDASHLMHEDNAAAFERALLEFLERTP